MLCDMDDKPKFTPDQRVEKLGNGGRRYIVGARLGEVLGAAYGGNGQPRDANAALWAAAPKMYEALRAWEELLVSMWGKHWPDMETAQSAAKTQDLTRAALAMVEGK